MRNKKIVHGTNHDYKGNKTLDCRKNKVTWKRKNYFTEQTTTRKKEQKTDSMEQMTI
jgi:hypothetical protein